MRAVRGDVTVALSVVHGFQRLSRPPTASARGSPSWSVPLIALAICAITRAAFAQSASGPAEEPRVEFWGALTPGQTGPSGSVVSSYSPPLLLDGSDYTSHASQTVTFDGHTSVGFEAGANLFFARHAGLQLLFDRQSPDLEGTNGPYDVTLNYVSRPPPDNQPIPVTVNKSTLWPDTTGSITQSTFSVNGVVRVGTSSRIDATLSGGLSIQRLSGTVQPVGFTQYNFGGHSVLFENEYRLAMSLAPTSALGFNLGGDLNVHVARHVALLFGYRYFGGPSVDMPVHVASVLNPEEITFAQTIADIERWMAPAPAHVHITGWHVLAGMKVKL
jgi:hypothetical protein